jgi:hypothetical protein
MAHQTAAEATKHIYNWPDEKFLVPAAICVTQLTA